MLELESSASSDEAVRERIASLPPEVSEVQLLSKLEGNWYIEILSYCALIHRTIVEYVPHYIKNYNKYLSDFIVSFI